jgi:hypothetical protein
MRSDRSAFPSSPVIAAAQRRMPRHRRRRPRQIENNYIAETPLTSGNKKKNRNRPGAPPGNRNALKHGAETAEARAFRAYVWKLCREARRLLALRKLAIQMQNYLP